MGSVSDKILLLAHVEYNNTHALNTYILKCYRNFQLLNFLFCFFLGCEGLLADVVFLIDGSDSVSAEDFKKMKDIMEYVIEKFAIGSEKERVAVVQYGTNPNEEFSLNAFDNKARLLQEIRNIKQVMGKTYTGKALTEVLQSFDKSKGGRSSALKFLIALTDGESRDDVVQPAKALRDNFINAYAIGLRHANRSQILAIAGSHGGVFFEDAVASLKELSSEVLLKICNTGRCTKSDIFRDCIMHKNIQRLVSGWLASPMVSQI